MFTAKLMCKACNWIEADGPKHKIMTKTVKGEENLYTCCPHCLEIAQFVPGTIRRMIKVDAPSPKP
jgi:hypothetical protein